MHTKRIQANNTEREEYTMIKPKLKESQRIVEIIEDENNIIFRSEYMKLRFCPITDNIIRVTASKNEDFCKTPSPGICNKKTNGKFHISDSGSHFTLSTKALSLRVCVSDSSTKYLTEDCSSTS